jgi:hypothetical protein
VAVKAPAGRRRSRGARAAWGVLIVFAAVAVLVPLLVARPVVIAVVAVAAVVVGALAGVILWRRRNPGRELPSLSELLRPRVLLVPIVGLLAAAVAVFLLRDGVGEDASTSGGPAARHVVEAKYDATLTFNADTDRWAVHETIDVPLRGREPLGAGWRYDGDGVYVRARTIEAEMSFWPFERVTNVIAIPRPWLPSRRQSVMAADGSIVRLTGPRRLVGDTTPAPSQRSDTAGGRETVELSLTGLRHDPARRQVEVDVANSVGRSGIYAFVIKYGPWLLGLVVSTAVAFVVNRELNRRLSPAIAASRTSR